MPVLMLMLITLLNDGTMITIGYGILSFLFSLHFVPVLIFLFLFADNVIPKNMPERWNLLSLFCLSGILALVALVSSLLLLWFLLSSWQPGSALHGLGIGNLSYGQITTAIYLKICISDFLTLFSSRVSGDWFWKTRPTPSTHRFTCSCFYQHLSDSFFVCTFQF
jgi:H+-transporting ATPase